MKYYFKRSVALCLAVLLSLSLCLQGAYAAEEAEAESTELTVSDDQEAAEEESLQTDLTDSDKDETDIESAEQIDDDTTKENDAELTDETPADTADDADADMDAASDSALVSYAVVNSPKLSAPGTEEILIGLTCATVPEQAILTVVNQSTGEYACYEAAELTDEAALFRMDYTAADAGVYQLSSIAVTIDGTESILTFEDLGIHAVYGVDTAVDTDPDAVASDDTDTTSSSAESTVVLDVQKLEEANGTAEMAQDVTDALADADADAENEISLSSLDDAVMAISNEAAANGTVVITLDPGHDATHAGTSNSTYGAQEYALTLKIAQYCKEELEQYSGVTVLMTRESNTCPYPGTTSTNCNANRVAAAKAAGSDYYISIHLNSSDSSSVRGAEIYYPNTHYNSEIGADGKALAQEIQNQLVSLGLKDRGIKIRNSEDNTLYEDGSLADYYGVIKRSKEAGITGIIIEHAFLSSNTDYQNFLSSEAKLKQLGVADATGIVNYLGLSKEDEDPSIKTTTYDGIDYSPVYDYDYYTAKYPEVTQSVGSSPSAVLEYFVNSGIGLGQQGSANFDVTAYRNRYSDLRRAFGSNLKAYYLHFIKNGNKEGRLATDCSEMLGYLTIYDGVDYASVYNYNYYLNHYSDLKKAFQWDEEALLRHFVKHGMSEGRQASENFSVSDYRNRYSDLRKAFGSDLKAYYLHFIKLGNNEGRLATDCSEMIGYLTVYDGIDYAAVYDYNYYLNHYSDLKKAFQWDEEALLRHFVKHGMSEGRQASENFSVSDYRNRYSDLRKAFGSDLNAYYLHFIKHGNNEGRLATDCSEMLGYRTVYNGVDYASVYNYNYYLNRYSDLKKLFQWNEEALLQHFVNYGMSEGRQACESFNVHTYRSSHPDLEKQFGSNLTSYYLYYIAHGDDSKTDEDTSTYHKIMGSNSATVEQMTNLLDKKNKNFNTELYGMSVKEFCQLYADECAAEGVDAAIAFSQAMYETGWLKYGGQVKAEQFNFAGIKTSDGTKFMTFSTVQEGIRAQVQHLKAYASTDDLVNELVDPRFSLIKRGCAPYVEWLSAANNPDGVGWTTDTDYSDKILNMLNQLLAS